MAEDASIRIVDMLSGEQLSALKALGTVVTHPPGHTVFREGQPSRAVLMIQAGNVKVTRAAVDGTEVILAVRGVGEVIGDEGVLMGEPRSATMTTINEVKGIDVAAEDLLGFVEENGLWPVMYRAAVRRRRQADHRLLLARLDVKSRLCRWLLELAHDVGRQISEGWVIESSLSQHDLATRIGASRDAVAIELRKLRNDGLVTTGRQRILLTDLNALERISSGK